ncbi:MAG: glutamate-5-semialdehyde dehydrogenase [Planctomycetia bacterium]|nr:glutamate-5-semialdehyde dehydrogenase [Planctomycetia bacterium]
MEELKNYCHSIAKNAKKASLQLAAISGETKNQWLFCCADRLIQEQDRILTENLKDLSAAKESGLSSAMIDRLTLSEKTLSEMSNALKEIAAFPDPIGKIIESNIRPNGLEIQKVRVPIGVVFFIYESRPNVTTDAAAICVKSGNAVIFRGGKEAIHSNRVLGAILAETANESGLPKNAVQLIETTNRDAIDELLHLPEYINVTIPRGGESLIRRVMTEAQMPVIKHYAGNCHVYIDRFADPDIAEAVLINSKCQRLGTCNTAESLIIHADAPKSLFLRLIESLQSNQIEIRGDIKTCSLVPSAHLADDSDFYKEFLAPIISVKIVDSLQEAIDFINSHSSQHTEAIISQDITSIRRFTTCVDSSAVMVNSSTRLNDGGQFGLGAEIGISTDKFHARGPCGINELTSYKYVVYGNGHLRK